MGRSFGRQVGHYFGGQFLVQIASFVSFPLFTRLLGPALYGLMGTVNSAVQLVMPFAKCGMSNATERLYAEHRAKGEEQAFFVTTRIFSLLWALGLVTLLEVLLAAFVFLVPTSLVPESSPFRHLAWLGMLVGPLVFAKSQLAVMLQVVRARQETLYFNGVTTLETYLSLGLSVAFLFLFRRGLEALFLGQTAASALVLIVVTVHLTKQMPLDRKLYRKEMVKEALHFGTPLIWNEVSAVIGAFADRFVILALLDERALGIYQVGAGLAFTLLQVTAQPLEYAVGPVVFQRWADGGEAKVRELLEPVARWTLRLMMPMLAGIQAVAEPLIVLMSGDAYRESANILRLNFFASLFWGVTSTIAIAVLIAKRTRLKRNVVWFATAANVALAIVLVPRFGIQGAAYAFVASILASCGYLCFVAYRILPMRIWGLYLLPSIAASVAMYFAVAWIDLGPPVLTLLVRVAGGAVVYPVLLLALDADARREIKPIVAKVRARLGR